MYIYDLDNTILNLDSDFEWNIFLIKTKIKNLIFYIKNIKYINNYKNLDLNYFVYIKYAINFYVKNNFCKIYKILLNFIKYLIKFIKKFNLNKIFKNYNLNIISSSTNKILIKYLLKNLKINISISGNLKLIKYKYNLKYNKIIRNIINYKKYKIIKTEIFLNLYVIKKFIFFFSDSINDIYLNKYKIFYKTKNPDKILFKYSMIKKIKIYFINKI